MKTRGVRISGLVLSGMVILPFLAGCGGNRSLTGGTNPVPTISAISPTGAISGGAGFQLTINGTNFVTGSTISFGGRTPTVTFVSSTLLIAAIPASAIASPGTLTLTVINPAGGGSSNAVNFSISAGMSVSAGSFTPTASMTTARADHTATLLPNGKVLIAGGDGVGFQPLASAEIYDPSTGMFTPTGSMTTARTNHTATLLPNGRVLIAGGSDKGDNSQPLASAELYDPSTGLFTPTGSMTTAQSSGPAILLLDGRVFVAGEANAEIYDPAGGTFVPTGAYVDPVPVFWDSVSLLEDGRILLTGCAVQCSVGITELFDPRSGTFSQTGPRLVWDTVSTATSLMDGRVLFVGNVENDGSPGEAEVYSPASGTFASLENTTAPHEFAAAVRLTDGTVLIAGGQRPGGDGSAGCDLFVPANGTFAAAGNMTAGRHQHTATLLNDGTVLIVGGYSSWPTATASAETYKP